MRIVLTIGIWGGGLAAALLLPLWFNPYADIPFEPVKIVLFRAITVGMTLAWLGSRVLGWRERSMTAEGTAASVERPLLLIWAVLAYAAVVLLATVASVNRRLSLWGTPDNPHGVVTILVGVLFFLLLASTLRQPKNVIRLVQVLILASVPVTLYGFVQALGLDPLPWVSDSVSPVHATLGRSNFLGAYLAMVAPWTLAMPMLGARYGVDTHSTDQRLPPLQGGCEAWCEGVSKSRCCTEVYPADKPAGAWRFGLILLMQVACLALTLARGAWLGLIVGCVVLLALLAIRWRERDLGLAAGLTLLAGAAMLAALTFVRLPAGSQQAAAAGMSYPELRVESAWRRSVIWQHALTLVPARWPLGYGPATFPQVFASRYPPGTLYQGRDAVVDDPHNLLLERLLATGLFGLVAYAGVVAAFYGAGLALWRRPVDRWRDALTAAALASVAAYLTQALFNPDVIVLNMLFWLALAVIVALNQM